MQTKDLKELKEKFYKEFYKPKGIEGWHIEGTILDIWNFIDHAIQSAIEDEHKKIRMSLLKIFVKKSDCYCQVDEILSELSKK